MDHAQNEQTTATKQDTAEQTSSSELTAQINTAYEPPPTSTNQSPAQPDPTISCNPRLLSLQQKHNALLATLSTLETQRAALIATSTLPSGLPFPSTWRAEEKATHALKAADETIKEHIRLLHAYNEIKDVGQGLMGLVAEGRGVRVREVMGDFGVEEGD